MPDCHLCKIPVVKPEECYVQELDIYLCSKHFRAYQAKLAAKGEVKETKPKSAIRTKPDKWLQKRQDERAAEALKKAILRTSHGGFGGKTLINRIEAQMDKRRKAMEDLVFTSGTTAVDAANSKEYCLNKGRYEGLAAALAILRSTSMKEEIQRSNERLGIR